MNTTVEHQCSNVSICSSTYGEFENKYDEAANLGLSQDEYNVSINALSKAHQQNLKVVKNNIIRAALPIITAWIYVLNSGIQMRMRSPVSEDAPEFVQTMCRIADDMFWIQVACAIGIIPIVVFNAFFIQQDLREECKVALDEAARFENQKYERIKFHFVYSVDSTGVFAFLKNWMWKPTLIISTSDDEQTYTIIETTCENTPLITFM
jgi:hypothetical protein